MSKQVLMLTRGVLSNSSILAATLTLVTTCFIVISAITGNTIAVLYAPLVDAAMEIKLEATTAHLWLEEVLSGDRTTDINLVWEHLDQAEWYAQAMLEGGENQEGKFVPLRDHDFRNSIEITLEKLTSFRVIAIERLENASTQGNGSDIDQRFDDIFQELLQNTDDVETELQRLMASHLQRFRILNGLLVVVVLSLGLIITIVIQRLERRRENDMRLLQEKEQELTASNEELSATNEELEATNEEMAATNEEMEATNEEMEATNEEMEATNEELEATNEELEATNEEIAAANQELVSSNQEIKELQKSLQTNEERLDLALSVANDGMWDWNLKTNAIYFDPRYYTMAGYKVNEFPGTFEELKLRVHEDDVEQVVARVQNFVEGKSPAYKTEFRFKHKNGDWMWILARGKIVARDENGNPLRMVGTHSDITLRKMAEQNLSKSTTQLVAANQQLTISNEAMEATNEELITSNQEILDSQQALQASEVKYKSLFDNMQAGCALHEIVLDAAGTPVDYIFLNVNDSYELHTSLERKNLIGKRVTEVLPGVENDPADWIGTFGKVALTGISVSFENHAEPLKKWFSTVVYQPDKGQFAVVISDITEAKLAERALKENTEELKATNEELHAFTDRLEEEARIRKSTETSLLTAVEELANSNKELEDFAYIASHDLKEPLRGISNYSTFLIEDYAESLDEEGIRMLETLPRLTGRLEQLIDDLLNFSRVGRLALAIDNVNLDDVLNDVTESIQIRLDEQKVEIRRPRPLPVVRCDRVRVAEVFRNLITNGMKYNDKSEKWVEVGWLDDHPDQQGIVFFVRDNGIGIPEKHQDKVFNMFKRLHARDKFGGGTGAGMTIAKKIIARHNGKLWLRSEVGKGTTFYFTFSGSGSNEK